MAAPKTKPKTKVKIRAPRKGTKSEAILTLATTTPASAPVIAGQLNTSIQHVQQVCQRYGINLQATESFRKQRADILSGMQERILHSVDLEAINNASLMQRAATFGILYDKERLERGQSTANVAYDSASIRDRYQELKAMLAEATDITPVDNPSCQPK